MSVIEILLDNAQKDTELLISNGENGDDFSKPRDVDFVLKVSDRTKADTLCSFIKDNHYGTPHIEISDNLTRVVITVFMPTTQQVLCSVSALMVCLAELFEVEYDGWGCVLQRHA